MINIPRALLLASSLAPHRSSALDFDLFKLASGSQQQQHIQTYTASTNMTRAGVIALSHGGGPMPLLGDPGHADIVRSLKNKVPKVLRLDGTPEERPRAIVVVTAHWSEDVPTISSARAPKLYYDYGGFPPAAYRLKYDAPGAPDVAKELADALKSVGLKPKMDETRGTDAPIVRLCVVLT